MTIRIKAKFATISLIWAHGSTKGKDNFCEECFYELFDKTYEQRSKYDFKIVLGDFYARTGKDDIFGMIVGNHGLHDTKSANALRLVDFGTRRNITISNTRFLHFNIYKGTWRSLDYE